MTVHRLTTTFLTLAVVVTLTGCSTASGASDVLNPAAAAATTATPTATPKPVAGDTDGDGKLSAFEAQILASHVPKAYRMPDGSTMQINPDKPLPAAVVKIIKAKAARPVATMMANSSEVNSKALYALELQLTADSAAIGKHHIYVFQTQSLIPGSMDRTHLVWAALAWGVD